MKLTSLDIENFMSIRQCNTVLNDKGLVLIQGKNDDADSFESNGAGKSTIFSESITWALYGQTIRGQKGDKIINRNVGKNTKVTVGVLDDNGDEYTITRYRKHSDFKNHIIVYRNSKNITAKSDKDTDILIEQLFEMDFLTFTNSIMFGQGVSKMFSLSTDSEQKKILEKMLQIDIFRACQDLSKQYVDSAVKKKDECETVLLGLKDKKNMLESNVQELQEKEAELETRVKKRIEELNDDITHIQKSIDDLPEIDTLNEDVITYQDLIDKVDGKIAEYDEFNSHKNILEGDERAQSREYDSLERKLTQNVRKLRDIRNGKNIPKNCSECGQSLPLEDTSHIENHLEDVIEKLEQDCEDKMNELTETRTLLNQVNTALEGKKKHEDDKRRVEKMLREVEDEIKSIKKDKKYLQRSIEEKHNAIREQEDRLGETYTELIESTIKSIHQVSEQIEYKEEQIEDIEKEYQDYNFWANAFGNQGIKSVLLDSVVPFLNTRANYYLSKLSSSTIEVKFNTQTTLKSGDKRDKFSVDIKNTSGDDDYKSNSGGEKRRIDIAVNMALQDLVSSRSNKRIDLIVYDECFEGLDAIGCESVIELLNEKAKDFGTVLVITHNDNLKQLFNNTVTVSKNNGITRLEEDV